MSIANAKNRGNSQAPYSAWGKNIVPITPSAIPSLKRSEAAAQENIQRSAIPSEELVILKKLMATPPGTWFEYKINGYKKKRCIKFSWYSPITRSYIFVGPNGIQIVSLPEHTLTHDLYVGNARILEHSRSPIIHRLLNTICSKLKQATGLVSTTKTQHQNPKHSTQTGASTTK